MVENIAVAYYSDPILFGHSQYRAPQFVQFRPIFCRAFAASLRRVPGF